MHSKGGWKCNFHLVFTHKSMIAVQMTTSQQQRRDANREQAPHSAARTQGNQVTPPRAVIVDPRQFYSKWTASLKEKIYSSLYRYAIFIANPKELNYDGKLYKIVKQKMGAEVDETSLLGWWQVSGIKAYKAALNQKRQTLCNNLKLAVQSK